MVRWLTMGVYSGVWAGRRSTRTSPRASLWIQVQKMLRPPFRAIVQRCLITILLAGFTLAREDQQEEHGLWRHLQGILGTISSFVGGGGVSSQSVATPVAIGQTGTTKTSVPLPTAPKSTAKSEGAWSAETLLGKTTVNAGQAPSAFDFLLGENKVDVWEFDEELKLAQKMMKGDTMAAIDWMVSNKDLDVLWSSPSTVYKMLQGFPLFRSLHGVGAIMDKREEDLTPQDGLTVLAALRKFAATSSTHLNDMASQEGFVDKLQDYARKAAGGDAAFRDLWGRVQAGDQQATVELHDRVFDDMWGGVVVQEEFGTAEREPDTTAMLRRFLMEDEPELFDLISNGDPQIRMILEDPTWATKAAKTMATVTAMESAAT